VQDNIECIIKVLVNIYTDKYII